MWPKTDLLWWLYQLKIHITFYGYLKHVYVGDLNQPIPMAMIPFLGNWIDVPQCWYFSEFLQLDLQFGPTFLAHRLLVLVYLVLIGFSWLFAIRSTVQTKIYSVRFSVCLIMRLNRDRILLNKWFGMLQQVEANHNSLFAITSTVWTHISVR